MCVMEKMEETTQCIIAKRGGARQSEEEATAVENKDENNNPIIIRFNQTEAQTAVTAAATITNDIRSFGMVRSMDLIMYVLYSGDQNFVRDMVCNVVIEVANENSCPRLINLIEKITEDPLFYKCLFFLMLDFHAKFRFWVLGENNNTGLQPICHYKAVLFLKELRSNIVPQFLINETMRMDDFERMLKVEYIRS